MNPTPSGRAESTVQLILMLGVGSVAACASWSHVVDLAQRHGQPGWLAVADAAVLETLAVSMGLDVRRRRRDGASTRFAVCVLVAAVTLQLAAQVAQAPRTFWGWTMAALPAVGFLVLAKVAMTRSVIVPDDLRMAVAVSPRSDTEPSDHLFDRQGSSGSSGPERARGTVPRAAVRSDTTLDSNLLTAGRQVASALARVEVGLTRATLAGGLRERGVRVGTGRAGELLAVLQAERAEGDLARRLTAVGQQ